MKAQATHRNARMSPRKIRPLRSLLRGLSLAQAQAQLRYLPGKAPALVAKVLASAVANAKNNLELMEDSLAVADVIVDKGLVFKRFRPRSRGMAHPIRKRTAHITVIVEGRQVGKGRRRGARAADIKTLSADQYAARQLTENHRDHAEGSHSQPTDKTAPAPDEHGRPAKERQEKRDYQAFQKAKIQQQGGDRKKTYRRKSI